MIRTTMLETRTVLGALAPLGLITFMACSAEDAGGDGTGGTGTTAGTSSAGTASAGTSSAGTASAGTGNSSGSGSGGTGSSVAGTGNGAGTGAGGTGSVITGGTGGTGAGGASGAGSGGGATAGSSSGGSGPMGTPVPSAGCSKPSGKPARVEVANTQIIDFPSTYDGTKPFPLLIALHACGNPMTQWENLMSTRKATELQEGYIRLMPNTSDSGQCWSNYNNNIARIRQQYDDILAKYCVDTSRVFGIGHSSGAQMLVNILSHKADAEHLNFRAVSPVAADPFNVAVTVPVLYIDGQMDNQRSATSATNAVAKFRAANMCMDTSKPYDAIMGCKSYGGNQQVDPGCKIYDGCKATTIWCSHNDPDYGGTQHGVPCFALPAMTDFFKSH